MKSQASFKSETLLLQSKVIMPISLLDQAIPTFPIKKEDERIVALLLKFAEAFEGAQPTFFCKSPGRVNLIGMI